MVCRTEVASRTAQATRDEEMHPSLLCHYTVPTGWFAFGTALECIVQSDFKLRPTRWVSAEAIEAASSNDALVLKLSRRFLNT